MMASATEKVKDLEDSGPQRRLSREDQWLGLMLGYDSCNVCSFLNTFKPYHPHPQNK